MKEQSEIKENLDEDIKETAKSDTAVEEKDEISEEKLEDNTEGNQEIKEDNEQEDNTQDDKIESVPTELSKNQQAEVMVSEAKTIVNDAENQLEECRVVLSTDLKSYDEAKNSLKLSAMNESEELLENLGYEPKESEAEDLIVFEPKEQPKAIVIQDVSSGGFTGAIFALIFGAMTYAGMTYIAASKMNFIPDFTKIPTADSLAPVMKWYASLVGMESKPMVGGLVILLAVLLVMIIVYKIRVNTKATKNLAMSETQLDEAKEYSTLKNNCKYEMDRVDEYIQDAVKTLKTFEVILKEQKGKLARILHIESDKIENSDFHKKSLQEMKDTEELISAVKDFTSVPMSHEGKLSQQSSDLLDIAKNKVEKVVKRFY